MKISSLFRKPGNRNVALCLMVVITLSTLFAASSRGGTPAVPTGRPARYLPGASPAGAVATVFEEPGGALSGPAAAGYQGVTLARSSSLNTLGPASVSFRIGSYQYSSDGILHTISVAPFIAGNRVYLPVRYTGYAIGMSDSDIGWDPVRKTASLRFAGHTVTFALGSPTYTVDGVARTMDVVPVVGDGYMYIPARYFASAFGYNVIWNEVSDPAPPTAGEPGLNPDPRDVSVVVDTKIPQQLYVYRGTSVILATYCNTGIPGARTPVGVFQVRTKLSSDTMSGTKPDGSKYFDPGVPWVMYFDGGCAIHGFVRARYGFPQSVGCVELPVDIARKVYDLVPVGTRVYIK